MTAPSVLYESPDIIVVNKPSGLLTHPPRTTQGTGQSSTQRGAGRPSVLSWFLEKYPEAKNVGDPSTLLRAGDPSRPGIVHRLDKETSGLLMLVKNPDAFAYYKRLFHDRLITKIYVALVYGDVDEDRGTIDAPLFKFGTRQSMKPPRTTQGTGQPSTSHGTGRPSVTEYKVLQRYILNTTHYSLLQLFPRTGRTHQIRIHLRSIGHPIVCDPVYAEKSRVCPPELGRLFLHAQKLSFTTRDGQALTLEADVPDKLTNFLKSLR